MYFERTDDWGYIRLVTTTPQLWKHLADDFSGERETWQPRRDDSLIYVKVCDVGPHASGQALGFFLLVAHSPVLYEIHTALLPHAWGARARAAAAGIVAWTWEHTSCRRLITSVPASNRLALAFAKRAGMQQYGVNEKAYLKGGKLEDLILLGRSRPERE